MPAYCSVCSKSVGAKDNKITCTICCRTCHGQCVNLKSEDIEFMSEHNEKFVCPSCQGNIRKLRSNSCSDGSSQSAGVERKTGPLALILEKLSKLDKIAQDIELIKNTQSDLCEQLKKCSEKIEHHSELLHAQGVAIAECQCNITDLRTAQESVADDVMELRMKVSDIGGQMAASAVVADGMAVGRPEPCGAREMIERIKRSYNIIVRNIPEVNDTEDAVIIEKLVNEIEKSASNNITAISRVGKVKKSAVPRPVKICFNNLNTPLNILKNKKVIACNPVLKGFRISDDKSHEQLETLNRMRDELKSRIAGGEKNLTIRYMRGEPTIVSSAALDNSPPKN